MSSFRIRLVTFLSILFPLITNAATETVVVEPATTVVTPTATPAAAIITPTTTTVPAVVTPAATAVVAPVATPTVVTPAVTTVVPATTSTTTSAIVTPVKTTAVIAPATVQTKETIIITPTPVAKEVTPTPAGYANCFFVESGWFQNEWIPRHRVCQYDNLPDQVAWVEGYWACTEYKSAQGICTNWDWRPGRWVNNLVVY